MPLLCSIADIRARTDSTIEDDALGALIEAASDLMEGYLGMWLAPRPSDASTSTTLLFDVERTASSLRPSQAGRRCGIRSLTALGIASGDQPETGGVYITASLANVLLRPRPGPDGPASTLALLGTGMFYRGFNTVTATGAFGPATVPSWAREGCIQLATLTMNYNPGLVQQDIGDWREIYSASGSMTAQRDAILGALPGVISL
jgi:hypothetical protein